MEYDIDLWIAGLDMRKRSTESAPIHFFEHPITMHFPIHIYICRACLYDNQKDRVGGSHESKIQRGVEQGGEDELIVTFTSVLYSLHQNVT